MQAPNTELFRRLKIIQADFQDSSSDVKLAFELLSKVIRDGNQVKNAWKVLDSDSHQLIEDRGKRDAVTLARLLSNVPIQLSATAENPVIIAENYKKWLNRATAYFNIVGFNQSTPPQADGVWKQICSRT